LRGALEIVKAEETMGEMDIRVIKTIESIQESFLCCLSEVGFLNMTVKNITEKARINRSTFYKY